MNPTDVFFEALVKAAGKKSLSPRVFNAPGSVKGTYTLEGMRAGEPGLRGRRLDRAANLGGKPLIRGWNPVKDSPAAYTANKGSLRIPWKPGGYTKK